MQSARLYVGGLTLNVHQNDIEELFGKYGQILEVRMNRNFAFVQFSDDTEAQAAIKEINGTQHFGRRLDVQVARHPKSGLNKGDDMPNRDGRDRSPINNRGGGGGGGGGRGGMGGGRGGFGGGPRGGPDRGGMFNSGGGGGRGFDDEGFGGGRGGGDFRPDFRGGDRDFPPPPRQDGPPSFGRNEDRGGLFGPSGGRDFSLAPPSGFRDRDAGPGGKFWGPGGGPGGPPGGGNAGGGGGMGLNEKAFDSGRPRDLPPYQQQQERPPTHPIESTSVSNIDRTNDIEIIIVDKSLTEYGEMIERRMSNLGFSVDVLFPHEAVPLPRVLANIASRGTLYAVVITHVHQINGSLTLHILHGRPQEHRNMSIDDAVTLLLRNYENYTRTCREKSGPNTPPEQVRHLLTQVLNGRSLTTTQYDILVQFLIQEKMKLTDPQGNGGRDNPAASAQAELQTRILSILNKTSGHNDQMHQPPPLQQPGPLLQDPSIQKALDSLMQGGDLLRQIAPQQPAPFGQQRREHK